MVDTGVKKYIPPPLTIDMEGNLVPKKSRSSYGLPCTHIISHPNFFYWLMNADQDIM